MEEVTHEILYALVLRLLGEVPVKGYLLVPLVKLCEILPHKEQLLAGVTEHKEVAALQIPELILVEAWHLVDHRALEMDDLIVAQHQDELLRGSIAHTEGHLVMCTLPEVRIQLHIVEEVMHPAHVPLIGEAEAVILRCRRHLRPCGRLLCDDDRAILPAEDDGVQMLEELDGLEVSVSAVLIRYPLAILAAIVEVEHGRHRIDTESVDVILVIPVQCVADEEVLYLILTVIEDLRAPVRMLALPRVGILVGRGAVEIRQSLRILREVRRNPVKDHADAMLVKIIHHIHELLRGAMAARRCEITGHLIAPARIERMLRDAHQLDMGVAHIVTVLGELMRRLGIGIEAVLLLAVLLPPGTEMTLINRHRLCEHRGLRARAHPVLVTPAIA